MQHDYLTYTCITFRRLTQNLRPPTWFELELELPYELNNGPGGRLVDMVVVVDEIEGILALDPTSRCNKLPCMRLSKAF